ncbi:hypothetical protein BC833DRAFT_597197 [Globomyces pollinis-pini]|nr:hypothetical protein BC833DRAFT_597197 [Globomyces pollinis-pini]
MLFKGCQTVSVIFLLSMSTALPTAKCSINRPCTAFVENASITNLDYSQSKNTILNEIIPVLKNNLSISGVYGIFSYISSVKSIQQRDALVQLIEDSVLNDKATFIVVKCDQDDQAHMSITTSIF